MKSELTVELLRRFEPFVTLPDTHLRDILKKARLVTLPAGRMLFKRGDSSKLCYYLVSGSVDLSDINFNITRVFYFDPQAQHPLDPTTPHKHSAISKEEVTVLTIDKDHVDLVVTWEQAGDYMVTDLAEDESEDSDWMHALLESRLFTQIPPANIQQLFVNFQPMEVKAGQVIVRESEDGDRFYVVEKGSARVSRNTFKGEEELAILEPGEFFGEEALIGETVRNATVTMLTDGSLMWLSKDQFTRLLRDPVIKTIRLEDIDSLRKKGQVRIIDVRLKGEFKHAHVDGAECYPLKELRKKLAEMPKDCTYVVACDGGRRSELGAYLFREAGCEAYVLKEQMPSDVPAA